MSCITIELYFKKVISRLLVCTSASKGSSAELITGTKQIRHVYPPQIQEITIQRTKSQMHRSRIGSAYLQGRLTSSPFMTTQQRFCFEDRYHSPRDHFSCSKYRLWYPAKRCPPLSCPTAPEGDQPAVLALINVPSLGSSRYSHRYPINSYNQHN